MSRNAVIWKGLSPPSMSYLFALTTIPPVTCRRELNTSHGRSISISYYLPGTKTYEVQRHSSNTIPSGARRRAANAVIWMGLSPPSMSYHPCPCHNSTPWPAYVKEHKSWKGDRKSYSQLPPYAKRHTGCGPLLHSIFNNIRMRLQNQVISTGS